ncbi:hypothetical protein CR513_30194, partial [Mucuna pruriens]
TSIVVERACGESQSTSRYLQEQPRFSTARKKSSSSCSYYYYFFFYSSYSFFAYDLLIHIQIQTLLLEKHRNSSYWQISQIYICSWFNLLVNLPNDVVLVRDFIVFNIVFQIVGVAPRRTQHDVPDVVLQRFPHLLSLKPSAILNGDGSDLCGGGMR